MTALPDPLTPADCNLRGLPFMPMMVSQVMQSETFGLSNGDEFKAAFTLWCASWLELPAASLPSDDRMLEFLSRAKAWKKVKGMALRGWILCADGRLYHPVIAARAIEAWEKRTDYREKEDSKNDRQKRWRDQCKQLAAQLRDLGVVPPKGASLDTLRGLLESHGVDAQTSTNVDADVDGVDAGEIAKRETEKRQGQGQLTKSKTRHDDADDSNPDLAAKPPPPGASLPKGETEPRTQAIVTLLTGAGIRKATAADVEPWAQDHRVTDLLLAAAVASAKATKGAASIPIGYLKPIIAEMLAKPDHAPAAPRAPTGTEAKGLDESYEAYTARIDNALAQRKGKP